MIKQSTDLLYTFDELLNLLNTTDKIVLGIDEWYLDTKNNRYYEVPSYDFSVNPITALEALKLLESTNGNADLYSIVLSD